ncbi:MAG: hypothetical protein GX974_05180 [Clostridiales bacterium]|nr:hypothetical protein [Clostridiales bacterium]
MDEKSIPKKYRNVFKFTVDSMDKRYEEGYREYIQAIWYGYITTLDPEDLPRIQKVETWAATLEYYYCRIHDIDITKKEVASHYAISTSSIDYNLKRLKKATDRKMYL